MPMRKDILIWLAIWSPEIWNIRTRATLFVQEVRKMVLIEPIRRPRDAVIWTAVPLLSVRIAAVNVWAATS